MTKILTKVTRVLVFVDAPCTLLCIV